MTLCNVKDVALSDKPTEKFPHLYKQPFTPLVYGLCELRICQVLLQRNKLFWKTVAYFCVLNVGLDCIVGNKWRLRRCGLEQDFGVAWGCWVAPGTMSSTCWCDRAFTAMKGGPADTQLQLTSSSNPDVKGKRCHRHSFFGWPTESTGASSTHR